MDVDAVAPGGEGTVQAEVGARDGRAGAPGGASIGADTTAVGLLGSVLARKLPRDAAAQRVA